MFREPLAGAVPLSLEPLQTTDAHAYWQTFVSGRTDLPTSDLKVHLDRYLALPPEEQRSHFSRSEEHTSELQSRPHLVCRLLLEKKKNTHPSTEKFTDADDIGKERLL